MVSAGATAARTNLSEMLRLYRTLRGLTVRQLAPQIGISHATLSRVERGREMDLATFEKLVIWFRKKQHATTA